MRKQNPVAKQFRDAYLPAFRDGDPSMWDLEGYLRDTEGKPEALQALLHRAFGTFLAYYEVREQLDAALGEIIAYERHHEGDADGK